MDKKDLEALAITQEECAEVIQAVSKMLRFGPDSHWNGRTTQQDLELEVGDLLAMVDILVERGVVRLNEIEAQKVCKREKLHKWSSLFDDSHP